MMLLLCLWNSISAEDVQQQRQFNPLHRCELVQSSVTECSSCKSSVHVRRHRLLEMMLAQPPPRPTPTYYATFHSVIIYSQVNREIILANRYGARLRQFKLLSWGEWVVNAIIIKFTRCLLLLPFARSILCDPEHYTSPISYCMRMIK